VPHPTSNFWLRHWSRDHSPRDLLQVMIMKYNQLNAYNKAYNNDKPAFGSLILHQWKLFTEKCDVTLPNYTDCSVFISCQHSWNACSDLASIHGYRKTSNRSRVSNTSRGVWVTCSNRFRVSNTSQSPIQAGGRNAWHQLRTKQWNMLKWIVMRRQLNASRYVVGLLYRYTITAA